MIDRVWFEKYDERVPHSIEYPKVNLFEFVVQAAEKHPEKTCLVCDDREITYGELDAQTTRMAKWLVKFGLLKGARVGLFLPNIPEFVIAFYAILKAGGVVAALNPQYKEREFSQQAGDVGINILFTLSTSYKFVKSLQTSTEIGKIIVINQISSLADDHLQENGLLNPDVWFDYLVNHEPGDNELNVQVSENDPAIFQYTGGTTGVPKAAIGLHRNLVANTLQFRSWLVNTQPGSEKFLMAIPMYHVYGMVLGMSLCIASLGTLVLIPNPRDIQNLLKNIERHHVSIFPGVPSLFGSIIRHPDIQSHKFDLRSIKVGISGSAPLPKEIKEGFESLISGPLCGGYGLSEAPTATHCNPVLGENKTGSIGLPLPDVDCKIVDMENGEIDVNPGESGELLLRGPQVMSGYHRLYEETQLALRDGWLHTGDIARMDEDGYFYLVGRKKEVIKVSGFQVWPTEVEEVITSHPYVQEACVAGVPDARKGETVKAWIIVKPVTNLTSEEIHSWCERFLAYYKIPSQIEFREELPRTPVGKILRRELIRQHLMNLEAGTGTH